MNPIVGRDYNVIHERFGSCVGRVLSVNDDWVTIKIVKGKLIGMAHEWTKGCEKTLRRDHATLTPRA